MKQEQELAAIRAAEATQQLGLANAVSKKLESELANAVAEAKAAVEAKAAAEAKVAAIAQERAKLLANPNRRSRSMKSKAAEWSRSVRQTGSPALPEEDDGLTTADSTATGSRPSSPPCPSDDDSIVSGFSTSSPRVGLDRAISKHDSVARLLMAMVKESESKHGEEVQDEHTI